MAKNHPYGTLYLDAGNSATHGVPAICRIDIFPFINFFSQSCSNTSQCPAIGSNCVSGTCTCDFALSDDGTRCVSLPRRCRHVAYNIRLELLSFCKSLSCRLLKRCRVVGELKRSPSVSTPRIAVSLGGRCAVSTQCQAQTASSACVNSTCICTNGLWPSADFQSCVGQFGFPSP